MRDLIFFRFFFAFFLLIASIAADNIDFSNEYNNKKMNCFIQHLQRKKFLRSNFENFPTPKSFNESECENFVKIVENFYYARIKNGTSFSVEVPNFRELLKDQGDCVEKQLREKQYGDLFIKSLIYDALKPLSRDLEVERNETTRLLSDALGSAISACTFQALYDSYVQIRRNNYCTRKYVIDNDIMGMRNYNLTLNPFRIDVSKINCTETIQKLVDSTGDANELGKTEALRLLSHEWAVIFLTEIKISDSDRMKEEQKYEKDIKSISG
jgi:hypothetical protein